jgi:hypothetical protein
MKISISDAMNKKSYTEALVRFSTQPKAKDMYGS